MGRVLGLDFGTRRVGAAISDPRRRIASPLGVYERRDPVREARHYRALVENEGVDRIVIGLPLHTSGGEGALARLARAWGAWLAGVTERPVTYHDERYSSVDADDLMRSHGLRLRDRKSRRDMLAAQIVLQNYLDAGCPEAESPGTPLADRSEEVREP